MTYLEKITFLTGKYLQLSQFALYNAFKLLCVNEDIKGINDAQKGVAIIDASLARAKKLLVENEHSSADKLLDLFDNSGISTKDYKRLKEVILKRDYLTVYYYIDNASGLEREDPTIYASKIAELNDFCTLANDLNISLSKALDKAISDFLK